MVQVGSRVIPEMARMVGGQAQVTRAVLHDRDREAPREIGESFDRRRVVPGAGGDEERVFGHREDAGRFLDRALVGARRGGGDAARRAVVGEARQRRRQDFARQRQIDRPAGRGSRDGKRAVDHRFELLAVAQFVVPFDDLAQHAGLIEHFLRPVDVDVAGSRKAALGQRRAAGGEQDRYVVTRRIEGAADAVGSADADMHHDRRHPARHHRVAVRHREGEVLVRREHRLRHRHAGPRGFRERLDERREIGARIGEQIFDPTLGEQREIGFGHIVDREFFASHEFLRRRLRPLHDTSLTPLRTISRPSEGRADALISLPGARDAAGVLGSGTLTRLAALGTLSRNAGEGLPQSSSLAMRERGDQARKGLVGEGLSGQHAWRCASSHPIMIRLNASGASTFGKWRIPGISL